MTDNRQILRSIGGRNAVRDAGVLNVPVYLANDAAGMSLNETAYRLKRLPLYRGEVKFRLRNVERQWAEYQATLADVFSPSQRQLHMDMLDEGYEVSRRHVAMIRQTALNFFTKEQVADREAMAYVVETEVMFAYASQMWKAVTQLQRQLLWNWTFTGDRRFCLTRAREAWGKVIRLLIPGDLFGRLCEDKDFVLAQECFGKAALNFDKISESCERAIKLNRETVEGYLERTNN